MSYDDEYEEEPRLPPVTFDVEGMVYSPDDAEDLVAWICWNNRIDGGMKRAFQDMDPADAIQDMTDEQYEMPHGKTHNPERYPEHKSAKVEKSWHDVIGEDGKLRDLTFDPKLWTINDQGERVRKRDSDDELSQFQHAGPGDKNYADSQNDRADALLAANMGMDFDSEDVQDLYPDLDEQMDDR